jgi:hypothetical protein
MYRAHRPPSHCAFHTPPSESHTEPSGEYLVRVCACVCIVSDYIVSDDDYIVSDVYVYVCVMYMG